LGICFFFIILTKNFIIFKTQDMDSLINWFYDQNFEGANFNIQPDEILFSFADKGEIFMRQSDTGKILVKLEAQSFINRIMASRYLAQAYTLEDLGISATSTDAANNWSAWQKLDSNGWQPGTSNIIKNLVSVLATGGKDKPSNSVVELGRLISSVYPPEYHSLIWHPEPESHLLTRTFLNNYDTYNLVVLLLKNVIQSEKIAKGRANKIYQPKPVYITDIASDKLTLGTAHKAQITDILAGLDAIAGRLNSARVGIAGAISINPIAVPKEEELYATDWVAYELLVCAIQNFTQFKLDSYALPRDAAEKIGDNIQIFRVQYNDTTLAKRFDPLMTQSGKTLFHGSGITNWYSIFYNGLYDGTASGLLLNGAAHGIGIYLSDNIGMSLGYSMGRGMAQNEPVLVGVFQVECDDIKTYKKTSGIYVVDKSEVLALRYLIKVNPLQRDDPRNKRIAGTVNLLPAEITALNSYFISDGAARQTQAETLLKSSKGIVRKQKEMQKMFEQQNQPSCGLDYKFDLPDEDNINKWRVDVNRSNFFDSDPSVQLTAQTPLYQDMVACGIDSIQFEITLPDDYPLSPPFIRIITPRFVHLTGHITIGGSICSELLMKQNWVPTLSILKVMIIICHNMIDGGARLERGPGLLRPYTFTEAEAAYNRMIRTHGIEWSGGKK
jgi:hypothetical protein